ncbi:two-component system response regulator [Pedobacter yulinensis]|uniref:Two-component system response regulator n=1 Tax=Pedobacter yulinensis TaxID=2126353 RepID=A0A2T3HM97_9SPHI|nr:response regulator [Pedobacter yulinensis]PST83491.1 two-component system response regulator [Pedobacter yulinensis]
MPVFANPSPSDKKRILIVDDEPSILKLLNFILSPIYQVFTVTSGYNAHLWLEEGNMPDLIISDMNMPHFDGQSFMKSIKISGFYRDIPLVILSAAEDLQMIVKEMPFTVEAFLPKPFNPEVLKNKISEILSEDYVQH